MSLRRAIRVVTYAVLFLTVWFLWPRELDGTNTGASKTAVPDYSMTNAHYVSVKAGKLELETHAKEAAFNLTTHRMEAKNVVAFVYNSAEERTIITADRADFRMDERILHLNDNVNSLSPDGFLLQGPEAVYTLKTRQLTAPLPVYGQTFTKDAQVWGDKAEGSLDDKKMRLIGNARALYHEPKHGETRMRGDSAVMERQEGKVTFMKNVRVDQENIKATSDTGDLYYSAADHGIRYMSLNTDVKIAQPDGKYTRSQVAEFFAPTDTIVLTGFPAVYDGEDAVTGDKITLYRGTGVVEVTATNAAGAQPKEPGKKGSKHKALVPELNKEDDELIP
jgi:LPS export ABC transporter protein LptC